MPETGLGSRIRLFRQRRKLTLAELGERVGVSLGVVNHWERGRTQVPAELVRRIADALDVTVERLYAAEPDQEATSPAAATLPPDLAAAVEQAARRAAEIAVTSRPIPVAHVPGTIPLYAYATCGDLRDEQGAVESEAMLPYPPDAPASPRLDLAVRVQGTSMLQRGIQDGDIVYIHRGGQPSDGQVVLARIWSPAGQEVGSVVKVWRRGRLWSNGDDNEPIFYSRYELIGTVEWIVRSQRPVPSDATPARRVDARDRPPSAEDVLTIAYQMPWPEIKRMLRLMGVDTSALGKLRQPPDSK